MTNTDNSEHKLLNNANNRSSFVHKLFINKVTNQKLRARTLVTGFEYITLILSSVAIDSNSTIYHSVVGISAIHSLTTVTGYLLGQQ